MRCETASLTRNDVIADAQRTAVENAPEQTGGDVAAAAMMPDRKEKALYRLMDKLGIPGKRAR